VPAGNGSTASQLLRVSVTAEAAGLDERALVERMRTIFPGGIEETYDESGRFEVAAYESPPLTLPAGLGSWRVEPVADARVRSWEEPPHGIAVAGRLWVGPPAEPAPEGLLPVVVDARRAFGSGTHATTLGCLELLCEVEGSLSMIDLGCGSGVLAIAAAKLGHAPVHACDNDPLATSVARAAAAANGVDVDVFVADAVLDPLPACDLWIANLLGGPVADVLAREDAPARAIISGLVVEESLDAPAFEVVQRLERAGWQALELRRRS
jgi:ribosomal protein L11 methyltransferase